MSPLLDLWKDPRAGAVADGFGSAFKLMVAAIETGEPVLLRTYDEEWSRTLPNALDDYDDLGDVITSEQGALLFGDGSASEERRKLLDNLRLLRAIYRLGALAWILRQDRKELAPETYRIMAQIISRHFADAGVLTFVTGRALEISDDRRLAWTSLLFEYTGTRVVARGFARPLATAYACMLMDLPHEEILPERWLEEYRSVLEQGIENAWPLNAEPSYWDRNQAGEETPYRLAELRAQLHSTLEWAIHYYQEETDQRVRRADLDSARVESFKSAVKQSWASHRGLAIALRGLGAPTSKDLRPGISLLREELPKDAFVGERAEAVIKMRGDKVGYQAATEEILRIVPLLQRGQRFVQEQLLELEGGEQPMLAGQVRRAIRDLADHEYMPNLILTSHRAQTWTRLRFDPIPGPDDRQRLAAAGTPERFLSSVRGRVLNATVLTVWGLPDGYVYVLDAARAIATPVDDYAVLTVTVDARTEDAEFDQSLKQQNLYSPPEPERRRDEALLQVDVSVTVSTDWEILDAAAIVAIPLSG